MIAPVIDQVVVTPPESTASSEAEVKAADLLTFKIGMAIIAAVIVVMATVGALTASAPLLIASGVTGSIAAFVGTYTGINLMSA